MYDNLFIHDDILLFSNCSVEFLLPTCYLNQYTPKQREDEVHMLYPNYQLFQQVFLQRILPQAKLDIG